MYIEVEVEFGGPAGLGNQPKNCSQDSLMMQLELNGHQHLTNILAMAFIICVETNHQVVSYLIYL